MCRRFVVCVTLVLVGLTAPPAAWADPSAPGLVAAYAFDEGAGGVAVDASGNGHFGTISGATWTTGRFGAALDFNGVDASVLLGSLGTFYNGGFTLEAWVRKATDDRNDVAVVGTWAGGGPMLWVDHLATRYHVTLGGSLSGYLDSGRHPAAGQWQHLAATYDGTTARIYVDGAEVASQIVSGSVGGSDVWRVGAYGAAPGGFFDGLIDEIRIYDRSLSASEIQADMDQPVSIANGTAPTMPADLAPTGTTQTSISVGWGPSTDNHGVSGYILYLDGSQVATTTSTSFTFDGLVCSTGYQVGVEAFDASGNVSPRALETSSTTPCPDPVGLVAAYAFDEGSGEVVTDASGRGHTGTISGATWASGRHGGGLSFDGNDDFVTLGSLGTFYQDAFTLEAWLRKTSATESDAAVVGTWSPSGGPMIWVDHLATRYHLTLGSSYSGYLDSGQSPLAGEWQHLAATFDGTTARFYVDGTEVASRAVTGSVGSSDLWRVGAFGGSPGSFFDGLIDDVRIYDEALSESEIQADMNAPVPPPDVTPPTAPGTPTATGGMGQVSLAWGAASDDTAVKRYAVHRSTSPGFTPTQANRIAQPLGTSYTDIGLAAGSYHYKVTATDPAGNVGPASGDASATVTADTTEPTVEINTPNGGTIAGPVTVTAASDDDQGVVGVQFRLDGQALGAEDRTAPYEVGWDTRGEVNGAFTLSAVARDGAGNATASAPVHVTVDNPGVSTDGLRLAYGFDEGSGMLAADSSGNAATGTLNGATWTEGRFGGGVSLDGSGGRVDPQSLGTFYKTAFTYEAWVYKQTSKPDAAVVGTWTEAQSGGAMIWVDHATGRYRLTLGGSFDDYLDSGRTPLVGRWQHVAATYDGSTARFYVDGAEVASKAFAGNLGNSSTWRIGAYGVTPNGFFDGVIDDVRIYDRALSPSEVAAGMATRIQPDRTAPTVTSSTPSPGATGVGIADSLTVTFSEPMQAASITPSTFELRTAENDVVPASVAYDQSTNAATLSLQSALAFGTEYSAVIEAGGVKDLAGNALAADATWSFTTEGSSPRVLVVGSPANPFGRYLGEILRNEGLNGFTAVDVALLSAPLLESFDVVVLGETPLSAAQVSMLGDWVAAGGNLIAMRPDKQLASLLGLSDTGSTLTNAYLKAAPWAGIVTSTIQFHGAADRYALNGATAVATLYSNASTATSNPAVTIRSVGPNGGQAAAFTYDLARSVVYTRQGNPAWAGQERDGMPGIRPSDMFYGAKPGDVQPDWIDTDKIEIPQADEQQRLLLSLIVYTARDRIPLPRFWYLPRGEKAAVVLSGDDHAPGYAPGGTADKFDQLDALSPEACSLADWECVRATSYIFPDNPLTDAQVASYAADGFEIALHPQFGSCPIAPVSQAELAASFAAQLDALQAAYPSLAAPVSSRTHCVFWPDWVSEAKVERALGIRMDANTYHYPPSWIGDRPGFMNGGGFPMRFADLDGSLVDVYQQNTNLTDESTGQFAETIDALLDNALGPQGYYGAFGVNIHTDNPGPSPAYEDVVAAAQARGVPLISYAQLLEWVDGRSSSTIEDLAWSAGTLTFRITVGAGANGLQAMLPVQGPAGSLSGITREGSELPYTVQAIKGLQYAIFDAAAASYAATYS